MPFPAEPLVSTPAAQVSAAPSPAVTAAAVSALVMAEQYGDCSLSAAQPDLLDTAYKGDLSELLIDGVRWLSTQQNPDGGFGSVVGAPSELATSILVLSAFRLTCVPAKNPDLEPLLDAYVRRLGGAQALKKKSLERAYLQGVLTNAALAGVVAWRQTPVVRFERATAPGWLRRLLATPQFDQQDPVLLASGLARFRQVKAPSPFVGWSRRMSIERCLAQIAARQRPDGGFDSPLATCFVTMALAGAGRASGLVVRRAVEYLLCAVGPNATWCDSSEMNLL